MTETTTMPPTLKDIYGRYREIAPVPDPSAPDVTWQLSRRLLVDALRANARAEAEVLSGGLSMDTLAAVHAGFAAVHLNEAARLGRVAPPSGGFAAEVADAIRDGGGIGEWLWEHSQALGIDANEVTRLAGQEAQLKAASAGPSDKDGADKTRDALRQTARTLDGLCLTMSAAMVEYRKRGAEAAMQWIITATEDWDESEKLWDGKETAQAYYNRLRAHRYVNDDQPARWVIDSGVGGWVCAVPDPGKPDGICGNPVESEPCGLHAGVRQ